MFLKKSTSSAAEKLPLDGFSAEFAAPSQVMQEYLHTMDRFLNLQREVMSAFFRGTPATPSSIPYEVRRATGMLPAVSIQDETAKLRRANPAGAPSKQASAPAPAVAAPSLTNGSQLSSEAITQRLLQLVSEKTGYPTEMIDLRLNLEADLGIDSIKRVEILGAFRQQTGLFKATQMERAARLKTLEQIIDFLAADQQHPAEPAMQTVVAPSTNRESPPASSVVQTNALPLIGSLVSLIPGQELVTLRVIDLNQDLFLEDHTLGRSVAMTDPELLALPVVPLTISMEMLAQAASLLLPDKRLVGMRDIRAYRWIGLDRGRLTLQLVAKLKKSVGAEQEIDVSMRELAESSLTTVAPHTPLIEGTMLFDDSFPAAPPANPFPLSGERPSRWTPETLYRDYMFHGRRFQGVTSVDRWGENGAQGTLKGLANNALFRAFSDPHFLSDPVLLDAAGQLIAYWAAEHLETGFHLFPFRVEKLYLYGPPLREGEQALCCAQIALIEGWQVRSDIDIVGPDQHLLMRISGWWDKRFDLPHEFYHLRYSPRDAMVSKPRPQYIENFSGFNAFRCCLADTLSSDFLEAYGKIWQRALAHLVLSRRERALWHELNLPDESRIEWLLGRVAAKDAVRLYLQDQYRLTLCPADIEIKQDERGRMVAAGAWTEQTTRPLPVSLACSNSIAVAIAGAAGQRWRAGIEVGHLSISAQSLNQITLSLQEQSLLSELDKSVYPQWLLRLCCAKQSVTKALGIDRQEGQGVQIMGFEIDTGIVTVTVPELPVRNSAQSEEYPLLAYTTCENDIVVAVAFV